MSHKKISGPLQRRDFLKQAGIMAGLATTLRSEGATHKIALLLDPADPIAGSAPAKWAASYLQEAIKTKGGDAFLAGSSSEADSSLFYIVGHGAQFGSGRGFPPLDFRSGAREAISLISGKLQGQPAIFVSGSDVRGLVYGFLELADRVKFSPNLERGLTLDASYRAEAANEIRSIARAFVSEVEDKPWYYDRAFWRAYLTELATHRFNRFNLTFGLGYDFPRNVTGDYFHLPYPYLFEVPGYKVRVTPLSDSERDKNLETLRFIAAETANRGLQFQLGIWTHAYQWVDSPRAHHQIEGLTPETHAAYCRDALALLLKTCPEIQGLTMRVHGESGIPEGSYSFWRTLFEGITACGRQVEIDMHAKGVDQTMIDVALNTGMPVKLSPKYWAEHMGLAYHQADIRELEVPRPDRMEKGLFNLSNGSRRFLRYGYGDLFQKGRRFDILFRIWPGTQHDLLWGDPTTAAGYGRTSHFCGASGVDICEPLFFKGREGSGLPGGRCGYADAALSPKNGDWEKFSYTYRVWGRLLYDPNASPDSWRRYLTSEFKSGAKPMESAIAHASRVLLIVTTAHLPSASNHSFWPEIYTNMPIVEGRRSPYGDTPEPKRFGTVSPLDPQLFLSIDEYVRNLIEKKPSGKYTPIEVAQWLEDCATKSSQSLSEARKNAPDFRSPEFRRAEEDVLISAGLARFFAAKLRSGTLFEVYLQTRDQSAAEQALAQYRNARQAWASMAERARAVYVSDLTYGETPNRRGHWIDRIPAIDEDIHAMENAIKQVPSPVDKHPQAALALKEIASPAERPATPATHTPAASFKPGTPLSVTLSFGNAGGNQMPASVKLYYRHVSHAERWLSADMERRGNGAYEAAIPAEYTDSKFHMQYYFELHRSSSAWLYPGFDATLSNQPYFVVMQS